jgi:hypothetical protein
MQYFSKLRILLGKFLITYQWKNNIKMNIKICSENVNKNEVVQNGATIHFNGDCNRVLIT